MQIIKKIINYFSSKHQKKEEEILSNINILDEAQMQPFIPKYLPILDESEYLNSQKNLEKIQHLQNYYEKQNRPISPEQQLILELINKSNFLNPNKEKMLNNIYLDCKYIYNALEPLRTLNTIYTLDLTGGAVRDFILTQKPVIKDLDFMINVENKEKIEELKLEQVFSKKIILENLDGLNSENIGLYNSTLVKMCFLKNSHITKEFNFSNPLFKKENPEEQDYEEFICSSDPDDLQRVRNVLKIEPILTNYPIDLIVTDFNKFTFLSLFDFDICKCSFSLVNSTYKTSFPERPEYLISRFTSHLDFLADVLNKKITYNPTHKTKSQMKASFSDHIDRIIKKYPAHDVQIVEPDASTQIENYNFAKAYYLQKSLNNSLKETVNQTTNLKVKI